MGLGRSLLCARLVAGPDAAGSLWARLPWQGITFGHVILGTCQPTLQALRSHEWVHVRQYERWGPFFFLAYPLSSLWALLQGRHPYWDNAFECAAYRLQDEPHLPETLGNL